MRDALDKIKASRAGLYGLAAGGSAVGTGLNAPKGFSREITQKIAELTGKPFVTAPNKFAAQGSLDAMVAAMAAVRGGLEIEAQRFDEIADPAKMVGHGSAGA